MKLIKYIIITAIALSSLVSCSYLDKQPDDQLTIETVFENKTNMERWLAYIYTGIPKFYSYDGPGAIVAELAPSVGWESQGFKAILLTALQLLAYKDMGCTIVNALVRKIHTIPCEAQDFSNPHGTAQGQKHSGMENRV